MRVLVMGLCLVVLSGCALFTVDRPQITMDYGTACLTYADTRAAIAVSEVRFTDLCASGALTPDYCAGLAKAKDRLALADSYVRDQLRNPQTPVDWAKINDFLQQALGIAIRLGARSL